jgi:outer membrane protein insertion porin family
VVIFLSTSSPKIENNASTSLNLAAVRIEGATHTRESFLGFLVKPHLPSPFTHDESTLQSVLLKARDIGHTLQATDLFQSVYAVVEPSRDPLAAAQDVDLVFKTREKGRFFLKTSTEFGNSEGSAVRLAIYFQVAVLPWHLTPERHG